MRRAHAPSAVAVEVFVEENVIAEVRILEGALVQAVHRPMTVLVGEEQPRKAPGKLIGYFIDGHERSGAGGALDAEVIAIVVMELLQRFDDEEIDRKPDRSAPVRVAAEQSAVGFARLVAHREIHAVVSID